ncbi:hypothetical protein K0M31_014275 [Melipona bicolor]|uniref:Uncharacterized protein n=1 Tax=Melipona bicolor TaxID=60889 RepID=A0AA40G882_9HYME|nr:hypothetical protein K0M31_014275 [Melipona bicolor]
MLPRDIDIQPGQAAPRNAPVEANDPVSKQDREPDRGKAYIDTLTPSTEPLMYVIDLLCDALALRVPDRLSSGPMAEVPRGGEVERRRGARRNGRTLMETTRTTRTTTMEKGSPSGKRIPGPGSLISSLRH